MQISRRDVENERDNYLLKQIKDLEQQSYGDETNSFKDLQYDDFPQFPFEDRSVINSIKKQNQYVKNKMNSYQYETYKDGIIEIMAESLPMVKIISQKSPSYRMGKKLSIDKQKKIHQSDLKINMKKSKAHNKMIAHKTFDASMQKNKKNLNESANILERIRKNRNSVEPSRNEGVVTTQSPIKRRQMTINDSDKEPSFLNPNRKSNATMDSTNYPASLQNKAKYLEKQKLPLIRQQKSEQTYNEYSFADPRQSITSSVKYGERTPKKSFLEMIVPSIIPQNKKYKSYKKELVTQMLSDNQKQNEWLANKIAYLKFDKNNQELEQSRNIPDTTFYSSTNGIEQLINDDNKSANSQFYQTKQDREKINQLMYRTSYNVNAQGKSNNINKSQEYVSSFFQDSKSTKNQHLPRMMVDSKIIDYEETQKFLNEIIGGQQNNQININNDQMIYQQRMNSQHNPFTNARSSLAYGSTKQTIEHLSTKNQDTILNGLPNYLRIDQLKNHRYKVNQLIKSRDIRKQFRQQQFIARPSQQLVDPLQQHCDHKKICSCSRHKSSSIRQSPIAQRLQNEQILNQSKQSPTSRNISSIQFNTTAFKGQDNQIVQNRSAVMNNSNKSPIRGQQTQSQSRLQMMMNKTQSLDNKFSVEKILRNDKRNSIILREEQKQINYNQSKKSLNRIKSPITNNSSQTKLSPRREIARPPRFTLNDLPKYSKTLKVRIFDSIQITQVLGGKYYKMQQDQSPPRSPNREIEWTKTPAYRQFVLKLTEINSLENQQVGFRKYRLQNKFRTIWEFEEDMKNKKFMKGLLENTLKNIYSESEVQYFITILKKKALDQAQMDQILDKAHDTLEVLMCKHGLKDQFDHVMDQYDKDRDANFKVTLIKQLIRCKIMYVSLGQIELIFKIIKQRDDIQLKIAEIEKFRVNQPDLDKPINPIPLNYDLPFNINDFKELPKEQRDVLEENIALYCYQSSRLFIQITSFLVDSQLFKRLKFMYEGEDFQKRIIREVHQLRQQYKVEFGEDKIPKMDEHGKLIFDNQN
ncbi:UNKNOWN [Stylonychia lemnae]|uniref:Uncharacterized protein n=1 Tax=Stylonychia lemnae TaxID=5949 RepID=A0A078BCU9_STYLE|nr:UNKNOWN [Stylonychia lemnae]|eukprot:CDW91047.1 UNKNOWN [Stylonychia lemnae]